MQRDYDLVRGWMDAAEDVPFTVDETQAWREGYCLRIIQRTVRQMQRTAAYAPVSAYR